jgi:hypothetical protein
VREGRAAGPAGGEVVSLRSHQRYTADFRALACGQVPALRAHPGMSPPQLAEWLRVILGLHLTPETIRVWETGPPPLPAMWSC